MSASLLISLALFTFSVYVYARYRNTDDLWMMASSGLLLVREILELTQVDSLWISIILLVGALLSLLYGLYLNLFINKLLNKDHPLIIETSDIDATETINLEIDRIMIQIKDKNIYLKNGSKLWITDGLAHGIAKIKRANNSWMAINQKRSNRLVSPNWSFNRNNFNK
jgi:hypothetical protein